MQSIFSLLRQNWIVKICHLYREADHCAWRSSAKFIFVLANLTCDGDLNLIVYEQCPAQISSIYLADLVGTFTP
jgi:hypothetical protein